MGSLCVQLNIPVQTDYEDSRNQVRASVYVETANVWVLVPKSALWIGGPVNVGGIIDPPPTLDIPVIGPLSAPDSLGNSTPLYDMRGKPIRVELEVQRAMRVGVSVTTP